MDRRKFITTCSTAIPGIIITNSMNKLFHSKTNIQNNKTDIYLDDDQIKEFGEHSIKLSKTLGCDYCDFRVSKYRNQSIDTRENSIQHISDTENFGFSVRVIKNGSWGFAASSTLNKKEVENITSKSAEIAAINSKIQKNIIRLVPVETYRDEWKTPIKIDPFSVSIDDKINLLFKINELARNSGADFTSSFIWSVNEVKYFMSSNGSFIKQDLYRIYPHFEITLIDKANNNFQSRKLLMQPMGMGYEYIENYDIISEMEKTVEETKVMLNSKSVEPGRYDIILDPSNMYLTIHESCGHPSELDRALGYEANYAGTSFLTTEKLGILKYGSDLVNIVADRTQKNGLATRGYDDDGVKTTKWHIIKNGVFSGYQTTREMASLIGEKESNGCAYADSWEHFPIQRMPNISLEPGTKRLSLKELISDTESGIYIVGDGSWSIDMQRYNFQFAGQGFYEIKKGEIVGQLKDVAYQGNTVDFWNSLDAVCDVSEYKLGGSMFCGKGEPGQISPVSHGSSPARFKNIKILNTSNEIKQ